MIAVNNKILVSVDNSQKNAVTIGGNVFKTANLYEIDYRLKSPVLATAIEGNGLIYPNDILLCHHNLFYLPSPYHLYDNIFSIPFSKVIFAKILEDGELLPICSNIFGTRVEKKYDLPLPPDQREKYTDRIITTHTGYTYYKKGQLLLTRPHAPYDISYIYKGIQRTVTKISMDQVTAIVK